MSNRRSKLIRVRFKKTLLRFFRLVCAPIRILHGSCVGWPRWYLKAPEGDKLQFWTVVIMAATFVSTTWFSYKAASLQGRSVDLDTRPYLAVQLANLTWNTTPTDTFIGPDVIYHNVGKIPATNIETKFYIATDKDGGNRALEDYADEHWGGYKKVTFLAPGEGDLVPRRLSLSPATEVYYINVIVSYEGVDEDKRYWIELRKAFRIFNKDLLVEIDSRGNWDRNKNYQLPGLTVPNFNNYAPKQKQKT